MAKHKTIYCSHCNRLIENGKEENVTHYFGSPYKYCKFCGKTYIDERMEEPALFPRKKIFSIIFKAVISSLALAGVVSFYTVGFMGKIILKIPDIIFENPFMFKYGIPMTIVITLLLGWISNPFDWSMYMDSSMERLKHEEYFEAYKKVKGDFIYPDSVYAKYMKDRNNE